MPVSDASNNIVDSESVDAKRLTARNAEKLGAGGVAWLAAIVALQVMFAGFLFFGRRKIHPEDLTGFTANGVSWYLPERDLPIYILCCLLCVGLAWLLARCWKFAVKSLPDSQAAEWMQATGLFYMLIGSVGMLAYVPLFFQVRQMLAVPVSRRVILPLVLLPALVELLAFAWSLRFRAAARGLRWGSIVASRLHLAPAAAQEFTDDEPTVSRRFVWHILDGIVPCLLIGILYLRHPELLAGKDFYFQAFHHWDYYAIGPAVQYHAGMALGTEAYPQYGVGWPVLLAQISPLLPLSYGHAMWLSALYCCLYFVGVYAFLRILLGNAPWATVGVFLAVSLQVFGLHDPNVVMWQYPSSSILRSPLDIWFFLSLLAYQRSRRPLWFLLAGVLAGLSLLFGTDTGIYLAFAFVIYCLLCLREPALKTGVSPRLLVPGAWLLTLLTLVTGLWIASRGTLFQPGFLRGWLEVFWLYPSGISMIPVIEFDSGIQLCLITLLVYLPIICFYLIHYFPGRRLTSETVVVCLAIYGCCYLLLFIGRSHWSNALHCSVPFSVLFSTACFRLTQTLRRPSSQKQKSSPGFWRDVLAGMAAVGIGTLFLLENPYYEVYPGLFKTITGRLHGYVAPAAVCYLPDLHDVCVPRTNSNDNQTNDAAWERFQTVVAEMRRLSAGGHKIALITNDDPIYYLASGARPWCRYSPLMPALMLKSQVAEIARHLETRDVDYVLVPKVDPVVDMIHPVIVRPKTTDVWEHLRAVTRAHYVYDHDCGGFEEWRR